MQTMVLNIDFSIKDYLSIALTCKRWHSIVTSDSTIQTVYWTHYWTHSFQKQFDTCKDTSLEDVFSFDSSSDENKVEKCVKNFFEWFNKLNQNNKNCIREINNSEKDLTLEQYNHLFHSLPNLRTFIWDDKNKDIPLINSLKSDHMNSLVNCKKIEEIIIENASITNQDINVIKNFPNLRSLSLKQCFSLKDGFFNTIMTLAPSLKTLDLTDSYQIGDSGFDEFIKKAKNLKTLHLSGLRYLTVENFSNVGKNCQQLEFLYLDSLPILTEKIVQDLKCNLTQLKCLSVKSNCFEKDFLQENNSDIDESSDDLSFSFDSFDRFPCFLRY